METIEVSSASGVISLCSEACVGSEETSAHAGSEAMGVHSCRERVSIGFYDGVRCAGR